MTIKIPSFLKSASIYTLTNLLKVAIPFFLLPLLTTYLSAAEYGIVSMFQALTIIFLPLSGLNINSAIEREYFDGSKDNLSTIISNGIFIVFSASLLCLLLVLVFDNILFELSGLDSHWLVLLIVFAFTQNLCEILSSLLRVQNKAKSYGIFKIARTFLELLISVILVAILLKGWEGRLQGIIYSPIFFSLYTIYYLKKHRYLNLKKSVYYLKKMLRYGVPLIPHVIGGAIILYSDRFFITSIHGVEATGLYTVGYQIGMIIYLIQSSFNLAWTPWLFQTLNNNQENSKRKIVKFTYLYFVFLIICLLVLYLILPLIFAILVPNENFLGAKQFVLLIGLAFVFDGMYKMVVNYIFYLRKTYIISIATFSTALVNLVLNFYFVRNYGPIGAAQATVLALFLQFVLVWIISAKLYSMPWLKLRLL